MRQEFSRNSINLESAHSIKYYSKNEKAYFDDGSKDYLFRIKFISLEPQNNHLELNFPKIFEHSTTVAFVDIYKLQAASEFAWTAIKFRGQDYRSFSQFIPQQIDNSRPT